MPRPAPSPAKPVGTRFKRTNRGLARDIVRLERRFRDLQGSERCYRELFERANDAIIIFEPKQEIVLAANRRALCLYGCRRHEMVGQSLLAFTAQPAVGRKQVQEIMRRGRLSAFVTQHLRKDGARLLLEVKAAVVDYQGRPAIMSINRDISAQRQAETVVRQSEQRLRAARDASLDAFYVLESVRNAKGAIVDFRYADLNQRGAELISRHREAVLGQLMCRLFPVARTNGSLRKFIRVVEKGEPLLEEIKVTIPGLQATWLHQQIVRLDDGVAINSRDITAIKRGEQTLRESERRLRSAWEANLDACILYECVRNTRGRIVDFRCIDANRRGLEQANLSRAQLIGSSLRENFPFMQRNGLFARFVRVVNTDVPMREDIPLNGIGQITQWVAHVVIKVGDGFASVSRDITDRKHGETVLKALPRRIVAAQEEERRWIAHEMHDNVSQLLASALFRLHSLRNQLAAEPPLLFERIQEIIACAQSEVRRISHGLRPSELDDLGLAPALRNLIADFRARTGLEATLRCSAVTAKLPTEIKIGCYRIVQEALTNIERHARARRVVVRAVRTNGKVRLHISDDGIGFSHAKGRRSPGKSLGLEHMRERAELLGAVFTLGSKRGRGTKIEVCFPSP